MEEVELEAASTTADASPSVDKPSRLLIYTFGWIFAAEMAAGFTAFAEALINRATQSNHPVPSYLSYPTGLLTTQIILLLAAFHRGRIMAGSGSLLLALGLAPTKRHWPIVLMGIVISLWVGLYLVAQFARPAPLPSAYVMDIVSAFVTGGWATKGIIAVGVIVLAPTAEELFFRGWLWEGLARSWRTVPVMLGTTVPWFLMHVVDNRQTMFTLLPQAVCFAVARHCCGSVRASMTLHVLNNLIGVGSLFWFFRA